MFAVLRKAGKHKQESFNATRCCLFTKTFIDRFLVFLVQKYKEQVRWKSNTQLRWNFFHESGFRGKNTSKFTHVHCWTTNHGFSRSRQHVDDEPSMCSSVQLALITSGRSLSSHSSSMLKVPVNPGPRRRSVDFKFWKVWNFHALISTSHSGFTYRLVKSSHPNI